MFLVILFIYLFIYLFIINFGQKVIRPLTWPSELKKTEMHKFERKH